MSQFAGYPVQHRAHTHVLLILLIPLQEKENRNDLRPVNI